MYKFFTAILCYEFSRPEWQPIVRVLQKMNRLLDIFVGVGIVAGLVGLIKYAPILQNKRWTAIIILVVLVLFAMWLLAAVKRFHRATLDEMYAAQEQTHRDLDHLARLIERLTLLEGRSDALYFLLENRSWNDHPLASIAIHKDEIRYHEADIYNTFRDRLGSTAVEEHFQRLGPITEKLYEQKNRIQAHRNKLHELLQLDRAQRREINHKAAVRKQDALKRAETTPRNLTYSKTT